MLGGVPIVMCTHRLWRGLGGAGKLPEPGLLQQPSARLWLWSARSVETDMGNLVVMANAQTMLTLLFPLGALDDFAVFFELRFQRELIRMGIPARLIEREIEAQGPVEFAKNRDRSLLGSVNDLAYQVHAKLEDEHVITPPLLDRVQGYLNGIPHVKRSPSFASDAVRRRLLDNGASRV